MTPGPAGPAESGSVVLVDPAMTGQPFKEACRRRALPIVSLYTLDDALLSSYDRTYRQGDERVVHAADAGEAARRLPPAVRAVIPTTEPSVETGDALGELLALPGNPVATSMARRSKSAMRERAVRAGLRIPRFEIASRRDVAAAARRTGFPAIAKPQRGAGSHGVVVLSDADSAGQLVRQDLFGGTNENWLVEEYIRGREIAVNGFSEGGRHRVLDMWEYRQPNDADYDQPYWDLVHLTPEDPDWAAAERFVLEALDAYQVQLGPSHTEIKIDRSGPCLIELASRLPGAHMTDHWTLHSAIRPYDDTLSAYLGESTGLLTKDLSFDASLGICCLRNEDRPGVLVEMRGLDGLRAMPGVDAVIPSYAPGDFVPVTRDLGSLTAFVLVHGRDAEERDTLLCTVRHSVRLELK